MRSIVFEENSSYPVALLMKSTAFDQHSLKVNYVKPLEQLGVNVNEVVAYTLEYGGEKKVSNTTGLIYLQELMPELMENGVKYLYCTDSNYFKLLTKEKSVDVHMGYVVPCRIKGYEHMWVVLGINYQQLIYNPDLRPKIITGLEALVDHAKGTYKPPGTGIIHHAEYPVSLDEIKATLTGLLEYPALTCDIEAFSLSFYEAGIGTIAFAPHQHRGVAFACDYKPNVPQIPMVEKRTEHGRFIPNPEVRALLRWFFETYKGKLIYHNAGYDVKVLIYTLWMDSMLDTAGLLKGLEIMTRSLDDTKIITYLATNSTAGNVLKLKALAHEFAGNWAVDEIANIGMTPLPQLLQYNLVDCLSTWYVHTKYYPIMVQDKQEDLYKTLMLDSLKLILQIELTGMPMNKNKITVIEDKLTAINDEHQAKVRKNPWIPKFEARRTEEEWIKDYETRRDKAVNPDKIKWKDRDTFPKFVFNPGSGDQLQVLLFDMMKLPVLDRTETKQPATGEETLQKLVHHAANQEDKEMIESLISISQVSTILSTFLPAFKKAIAKGDDAVIVWLHGNFNIGGTVSGRLSSSRPNLQNIPAKSIFAKIIKEAFMGPEGWLFGGADFNSLEDMISALTTKDKNKLKVYIDGFDGHSLRGAFYFKQELEAEGLFIDMEDPKSVNQLKKLDHPLRQESKAPTFLLTYGGTYMGMMSNLGWSEEKSKAIEKNYHDLYAESDEYIRKRLEQASKDGYVEVAFGLRLRTPLLAQVMFGKSKMPYAAAAEGRTAGNAMGQSYGLLNNRAAVEFMKRVWSSKYRLLIKPVALIHDAIYLVFKDDPEVVEWVNRNLIECMRWQDLPEIWHPTVKLGAALDIYWPSWANAITLPNDADVATIIQVCKEAKEEYLKPKEKK